MGVEKRVIAGARTNVIVSDEDGEFIDAIDNALCVHIVGTGSGDPSSVVVLGSKEQPLGQDGSTYALNTVDYAHHEIHDGRFFYVKGWQDITGAGTNLDFLWSVPNTTRWPHAQWSLEGEAEFTMTLYEAVTTSNDGAAVPIFNANRNSANLPGVQVFTGPTLAGGALGDGGQGGTAVWSTKVGSGRLVGTSRETGYEFIGKQNTKYWFRITKAAAGTEYIIYDFNWYEHIDKE